jgi:hypothetical protein
MSWRKHPFLWTFFGLFAVIVLFGVAAQLNPSCLSWKDKVEQRTAKLMRGFYGEAPMSAANIYEQTNGSQTYWDLRREIGWRARQDLSKERPAGCF